MYDNEFETIETLRGEINERNEKIKEAIFNIVELFGGELECEGKSYKAIESDTGTNCVIESFSIQEEKLTVKANFDGDKFDLELSSFNALDIANILIEMLGDNRRILNHRIDNLIERYMADNDTEPLYAACSIMYLDDGSTMDVTIKFSCDSEDDDEDSDIFFYCNSAECLKHLTDIDGGDFVVISVDTLWR